MNMGETYIEAAMDHLSIVQSDHMATVLLEVESDIDDNFSAMDMALNYELSSFVAKSRIERVATSIMNDWEFLRPQNREEAFEINPMSIQLIWKKMWSKEFYLTPLGTYTTTMVLYFIYLTLFTYLSLEPFEVYDPFTTSEIIFWIFNMGYVSFEIQAMIDEGLKSYFSQRENYFDSFISIVFVTSIIIRIYGDQHPKSCSRIDDCSMDVLHTVFVILWAAATIALWLRIVIFCTFSRDLGPMVQMIFRMMGDIVTFFYVLVILFVGFTFALSFLMEDIHDDFENAWFSARTLFMAALGDFDFDPFDDITATISNTVEPGLVETDYQREQAISILVIAAHIFCIAYLVIASLILLNILIAMMAVK